MRFLQIMMELPGVAAALRGHPQPPADSVPAPTNVSGAEYPRITPDLRVIFRIKASDAQKVEFDLGKRYPDRKDSYGF